MANQNSGEGSSSGNVPVESADSTVQLNIKTLESQVYSVQADKNVSTKSRFFGVRTIDFIGLACAICQARRGLGLFASVTLFRWYLHFPVKACP